MITHGIVFCTIITVFVIIAVFHVHVLVVVVAVAVATQFAIGRTHGTIVLVRSDPYETSKRWHLCNRVYWR